MAVKKRNKSAEKRARQSVHRRIRNRARKAVIKNVVKAARAATDPAKAAELARSAATVLDKLAAKGTMHKNTAARRKSRLARRANKLAAGAAAQQPSGA